MVCPSTYFLRPPERTVLNSTCYHGKGMRDSRRNNSSLETLGTVGTVKTVETACPRRWAVGNRVVHVGGSLKTDDESFKDNTRLHQHGFVGLSAIVTPSPCMRLIQSREFVYQISHGNQQSERQERTG